MLCNTLLNTCAVQEKKVTCEVLLFTHTEAQVQASTPPIPEFCMLHTQQHRLRFILKTEISQLASWFQRRSGVSPASSVWCTLSSSVSQGVRPCLSFLLIIPAELNRIVFFALFATAPSRARRCHCFLVHCTTPLCVHPLPVPFS